MPGTRKLGRTTDARMAMLRAMVTYLLENGKTPDISYFSSEFTPDEMGKIVGIFNKRLSLDTNKQQVDDCVKVILGEQDIKKAADSASESDWAASIKRITDKKRGSK